MSSTQSSRHNPEPDNSLALLAMIEARADAEWCLFLDRDGVINRQIVGDYVRGWHDFEWLPHARSALRSLRVWAPHLVVVTNQQGVGKGLMRCEDVADIHQRMRTELAEHSVALDAVVFCPHLESSNCDCRKPRPGMVLSWLREHPSVVPSLSIMAGDSHTDIELAHTVAAVTGSCASILIGGRADQDVAADMAFSSLSDFADAVQRVRGA
nr:HAD family hydrolase [Mycolicibacterium iranicum]